MSDWFFQLQLKLLYKVIDWDGHNVRPQDDLHSLLNFLPQSFLSLLELVGRAGCEVVMAMNCCSSVGTLEESWTFF